MARRGSGPKVDASLLKAALLGFEQMKRQVDEKIASIKANLGFTGTAAAPTKLCNSLHRHRVFTSMLCRQVGPAFHTITDIPGKSSQRLWFGPVGSMDPQGLPPNPAGRSHTE